MNFNKKWLREKVESLSSTITNLDSKREYVGISRNTVLNLIDQIDELKITEEQALNKLAESYPFSADGINAILQAQLAGYSPILTTTFIQPIEPELPVIPQFVAELLEGARKEVIDLTFWGFIKIISDEGFKDNESCEGKFVAWFIKDNNEELLMRAWLSKDGYTIEKEPQWVVKDNTGYLSFLQFSIPNVYERETSLDKNDAFKFNSKSKADLIADLVTGTVVEVTDKL